MPDINDSKVRAVDRVVAVAAAKDSAVAGL